MTKQRMATVMAVVTGLLTMPGVVTAQAPDEWDVPRLADGRPDLQGIWANDSATPLQRPEALGDRTTLTEEEVAALQAYAIEYDSAGGDAVFGDTVFLRALASLNEPTASAPPDGGAPAATTSSG